MSLASTPRIFTRRMTTLYSSVLCTIALLSLLFQIVMQMELRQHVNDVQVITIASRQRMLSEELSKTVLEIAMGVNSTDRKSHLTDLKGILANWQQAQNGLQHGDARLGLSGKNNSEVQHLFQIITPSFTTMRNAAEQVATRTAQDETQGSISSSDVLYSSVQTVLTVEPTFLTTMESIVTLYEQETMQHMAQMQETELVLFLVTLFVLLFEGLVIFRPAVARIADDIKKIILLEERIAYMTEVQRRNQAYERTLHESLNALVTLKYPIQVLTLGHYKVQDEHERTYFVTTKEQHDGQRLHCECELYARTSTCSHFVAASSVHASLLELEHYGVGTDSSRPPNNQSPMRT